ncbi:hypothetical protein CSW98_00940 [Vibrio sp. HA2012]|uniref:hypothetical protein n=1 Tax=Vibrio sp. HA2012 TaxID=1971595 RepID=UPI000C2C23D6|nr:hypothetical protein [Vibrio sp. HA2012]PJC87726.1 hypothetical protein CSW98_00940 [Vibrio sp. HA2012]
MYKQLLNSLRQYAQARLYDVKKRGESPEFAALLIEKYTDGMLTAMKILGLDAYMTAIRTEAQSLCMNIWPKYHK